MKKYSLLTYSLYFAMGSIYPLLSQYLQGINFTGTQIGIVVSIGTLMSIIFLPIWGIVADKTNSIKKIIMILSLMSGIVLLIFPFTKIYILNVILYAIFQMFMCGIYPLLDAGILHSEHEYGGVRLWGSIGFAFAAVISAFLADHLNKYMIFIIPSISFICSIYFLSKMELKSSNTENAESINFKLLKNLFKNKEYIFFVVMAFFVGGTINANNSYFGLLYKEIGGNVTGIGIAFFLFAVSEAPFLRSSGKLIKKIGVNNLLLASSVMFCMRWFLYALSPSPAIVMITFFIQGLSIGTFLAGAAEYIRQHTEKTQTATAITFYNSFSIGVGAMVCMYISGKIMDVYSVATVYKFYFVWNFIGFLLLIKLCFFSKKEV